jgi:molecular chaperone Hsp33
LLIQALPVEVEQDWSGGEDWHRVLMLAATLSDAELRKLPATTLIKRLFHEERPRVYNPKSVSFRCGCSIARIENMLIGLGEAEVNDIIEQEGSVSVNCEFCNKRYELDLIDAKRLFIDSSQPQVPTTRH